MLDSGTYDVVLRESQRKFDWNMCTNKGIGRFQAVFRFLSGKKGMMGQNDLFLRPDFP